MNEAREKATIMIVDDTPENIDVLTGLLSAAYKIRAATNGERALKIAVSPEKRPDLILLDIMMPVMDGYEVIKKLKDNTVTSRIPVIFLTAKASVEDEHLGLELGAVDYITKPISPPIVLARVKAHLHLYDQSRALEDKVRQRTEELEETRLEIIRRLGRAGELKCNETGLHVIRMSCYSRLIGEAYGLGRAECELLLSASPMHDIGKIGIPDAVLRKPGKLDGEEWKIMQSHCQIGADIIGKHPSPIIKQSFVVALTHHEKWDGSGYPNGIRGDDIPLFGRIAAIADVFDALTSDRPYKKAWPVEKAVEVIKADASTHFDPKLVPLFVECLDDMVNIRDTYSESLSKE